MTDLTALAAERDEYKRLAENRQAACESMARQLQEERELRLKEMEENVRLLKELERERATRRAAQHFVRSIQTDKNMADPEVTGI